MAWMHLIPRGLLQCHQALKWRPGFLEHIPATLCSTLSLLKQSHVGFQLMHCSKRIQTAFWKVCLMLLIILLFALKQGLKHFRNKIRYNQWILFYGLGIEHAGFSRCCVAEREYGHLFIIYQYMWLDAQNVWLLCTKWVSKNGAFKSANI